VKKSARTFNIFFLLALTFGLNFKSQASDISDRMPIELVDYMQKSNLWLKQYDDGSSKENQDLVVFMNELLKSEADINVLVDNIFNPIAETNGFDKFPINYMQKINILRYYKNIPQKAAVVRNTFNAMNRKYVEVSAVLISTAEINEYAPILQNLMRQISSGEIQVVDLSPELRSEMLADEKNEPLHGYLKDSNAYSEKYAINGLYSPKKKIIAIDLMRPISESVVTLAHEIVHSSDPYIIQKKSQVQALTAQVKQKLAAKLSLPEDLAEQAVQALIADVLFEKGRPDLFDMVFEIAKMRKQKIERTAKEVEEKEAADRNNMKELLEDRSLQAWMSAIISSTVENEYRAYVLSLAVYYKLKHKFYILPASANREQFIANLTRHDFSFLKSLEASLNPFMRGTQLSKLFSKVENETYKKDDELKKKVVQLKTILDQHYLIQSENLFARVGTIYKDVLSVINSIPAGSGKGPQNDLDPWTEPGKFNDPTNTYTILTAKVSTSMLLQFKNNLNELMRGLRYSNEALLLMQAGILPLHNLNLGELKLLGLQRSSATQVVLPDDVKTEVKSQFFDNKGILSALFADQSWNPESLQDYASIQQKDLMKYLYQLHLAKSLFWLRNQFPIMKKNLVTLKVFGHKLNEKFLYESSEISDERAAELKNEIQGILNSSFLSAADFASIKELTREIGLFYQISADNKWNDIAKEFAVYIESAKASMLAIGVSAEVSQKMLNQESGALIRDLKKQIQAEYPQCRTSPLLMNVTTNKKFSLGQGLFRLTTICNNNQYYVLRQPGDYQNAIRLVLHGQQPNLNVFFESKPIALDALAP
jgi:hypothetical protein